jgi:REP-associated tyrosine transposase
VEYEGAIYHLMNRGDRRERIFIDDRDRERFLMAVSETCERTEWRVHAYCLMPNHFHLVVETPKPNLCAGMHWLLGTYTARFNRRHGLSGHLFGGRYKALLVDGSATGYLKTVCDYVHLNPVRAGLLKPEEPLETYRWSSYREYLRPPTRRATWLQVGRLLGEWRIKRDTVSGRRQFRRGMEQRKAHELNAASDQWGPVRQGWCWGRETFRERLLNEIEERRGEHHCGEELRESTALQAERLVKGMLQDAAWAGVQLEKRRKGDPVKVRMAARLRSETMASWKWIAARLQMGQWRSAANAVGRARRSGYALIHP